MKNFLILCSLFLSVNLYAQSMTGIDKGKSSMWYGVVVSSWQTVDQYDTHFDSGLLLSSNTLAAIGSNDIEIENDQYGMIVYISTFSAMNTVGRNCRPIYPGQSKSYNGKNTSALYVRMGAGLTDTTTTWLIITYK